MKITIAIASMILATAALGQEAQDLDGWRAAKWGMIEADVLAAFPGEAQRLKEPEEVGGRACTLGIPTYRIGSADLEVMFCFAEGTRLSMVRIAPPESAGKTLYGGIFSMLESLLVEKYGAPTSTTDEPPARKRMWRLPRTVVTLHMISFPGIGHGKNASKAWDARVLSYTSPSKEADKL